MSGLPSGIEVTLRDGTPVLIRPVAAVDRERLKRGVSEMSQTSRYMRFFAYVDELDDRHARYFTEIDQVEHVACCGVEPSPEQRGYGLARFIRDQQQRDVAHFAVAVIDEMQGRGLGLALLAALHVRARMLGICELQSDVLRANPVMPKLIPRLGGRLQRSDEPRCLLIRWPIVAPDNPPGDSAAMREFIGWMRHLGPFIEQSAPATPPRMPGV